MEKILNKTLNTTAVQKSDKKNFIITKKTIAAFVLTILSFFIGRICVFQGLNPVIIAFLSVFLYSGKIFFAVSALAVPGLMLSSGGIYTSKYLICIVIMSLFNVCLKNSTDKTSIAIKSITGTSCVLISGLLIAFLNGFSLYYTVLAMLEGILVFALTYVLNQGINTVYFNIGQRRFESNDILSLSILIGAVVAGSADIYMGNISVMFTLLMLIVMIAAYKNGSAVGCCSGILLSTVLMTSGSLCVEYSWIFGITGAVCGISRNMNKLFTVISFIFSSAICFVYADGNLLTEETIFSAVLAIMLFLIIPLEKIPSVIPEITPLPDTASAYILRMRDIISHRLNGFSESFSRLSKTFSNLSEKRNNLSKDEVDDLIDDVYAEVCTNCDMRNFCWKNNFYNTYQIFFGILALCEKNGKVGYYDMPAEFRKNCINADKLAEVTNRLFETYRLNMVWKNKIAESRELMGNQIAGISDIINSFSKELSMEFSFDDDMSKKLTETLTENGIKIYSAAVTENKDKKTEVIITHDSCYGRHMCLKEIIPVVNKVLGKNMYKGIYHCSTAIENGKNICKLKLAEEQPFTITTGVSRATKADSRESGDSHTFMDLGNGSYLLALSDGMGSGVRAKEESAAAIELFENFMETGFDKEIAVKLINSVLVLKSEPKSFSTLDICTINMYSGMCEIVKIGACESFIVSSDKTEVISSSSLPVGMLEKVDMETSSRQLFDGDLIIMFTDGVRDCFIQEDDNDRLENIIRSVKNKDPHTISETILNAAKELSGGTAKDDMTVLVAKVRIKTVGAAPYVLI